MGTLNAIVREVMAEYARPGLNSTSYLTYNNDETAFTVTTIIPSDDASFMSLLVRLTGQLIIIEQDQNDKPLVDELVQTGIPREQIILAYAGAPVPDTAV